MGPHRSMRAGGDFGEVEQSGFFMSLIITAVERWISSLLLICVEFIRHMTIVAKAMGIVRYEHY
jgi:hypothetical protein